MTGGEFLLLYFRTAIASLFGFLQASLLSNRHFRKETDYFASAERPWVSGSSRS
jgi:hypothetical protein